MSDTNDRPLTVKEAQEQRQREAREWAVRAAALLADDEEES